MKKTFTKLAALFLCICMIFSVGVVISAEGGEVVDPKSYSQLIDDYLPDYYALEAEIINQTNHGGLSGRTVGSSSNWNKSWNNSNYPLLKDSYGWQRTSSGYAYVDIKVESVTEYFAIGIMLSSQTQHTANFFASYYVTTGADYATAQWKPFDALSRFEPQYSCIPNSSTETEGDYVVYPYNNYKGIVDVVGNLPEGSTYLRVVIYNPANAWTPVLDFIDIYDVDVDADGRFENALTNNGYLTTASKTYFNDSTSLDNALPAGFYNDLELKKDRGDQATGSLTGDNYGVQFYSNGNSYDPYIIIPVTEYNAIEAGLAIKTDNIANVDLIFSVSSNLSNWTDISYTSLASKNYNSMSDATYENIKANYSLKKYCVTNLPEDTKYLKIYINATSTNLWWCMMLDYVKVFKHSSRQFNESFDGYDLGEATTYFNANTQPDAIYPEGSGTYYQNVTVKWQGFGISDGNYLAASSSGGYFVIPVEDTNVIETQFVIYETTDITNGNYNKFRDNTYLTFEFTSDKTITNSTVWNSLSDDTIGSIRSIHTNAYYVDKDRITNLPEGTKYIKISIITPANWQHGLDYVKVYDATKAEAEPAPPCTHPNAKEYYNPINNTVEKYCAEDDLLCIKGDANESGSVDIRDLVKLYKIASDAEYTDYDIFTAECNTAAGIDATDIDRLRQYVLGYITHAFKD